MGMPPWNLPKVELIQVYTNCRTDITTHDELLRDFFLVALAKGKREGNLWRFSFVIPRHDVPGL